MPPDASRATKIAATPAAGNHRGSRPSRIQPSISKIVTAASGKPNFTGITPGGAALRIPIGHDNKNPAAPPPRTYSQASAEGLGIGDWGLDANGH